MTADEVPTKSCMPPATVLWAQPMHDQGERQGDTPDPQWGSHSLNPWLVRSLTAYPVPW